MHRHFRKRPTRIVLTLAVGASLIPLLNPQPASAASSFTLPAATVKNAASIGDNVNLDTVFNANISGTFVFDTEIYQGGTKVAQWTRTSSVNSGSQTRMTQTWSTSGRTAGTYTVKTGVFSSSWSTNHAWNNAAASILLGNGARAVENTSAPAAPVTAAPVTAAPSGGNPLGGVTLAYNRSSQALANANALRQQGRGGDAAVLDRLGYAPTAVWLTQGWNARTTVANQTGAAKARGEVPIFVAYDIPHRDCGSYSSGGAGSADEYRSFINDIVGGLGGARAIVIVEPDALPGLDCLDSDRQNERYSLIRYAVETLRGNGANVYVDAGHANWKSTSVMADRLNRVNIGYANGFALNVSSYESTGVTTPFGDDLASRLGGKHYVIDTSRNGNGSNGQWCNPYGRHTGTYPTVNTGRNGIDAYLWLKAPGESDGNCNGGPSAGQFWVQRALELTR